MEPLGQAATQVGLRQCSHKRGKYIMKVFQIHRTWLLDVVEVGITRTGLEFRTRISSQLGPPSIFSMRSPVISERGLAVGGAFDSDAFCKWRNQNQKVVVIVDFR